MLYIYSTLRDIAQVDGSLKSKTKYNILLMSKEIIFL